MVIEHPAGFYVYQLCDPRTGVPFYVGKGQRGRAWVHERAVRLGKRTANCFKNDRIAAILDAGGSVLVKIVQEFDSEVDALDLEFRMIEADPTLTNVRASGGGSPLAMEKRQQVYLARRSALIQRRVELQRGRLLSIRGAHIHRDAIDEWVDGIVSGEIRLRPRHEAPLKRSGRRKRPRKTLAGPARPHAIPYFGFVR